MLGFRLSRAAASSGLRFALLAPLCLAMAGCGVAGVVRSAFDRPLNISGPASTAPGSFTVTADDASAAVANAAAVQQAAATCASFGLQSRTVDSSSTFVDGRNFFTLDFQCQ